MSERFGLFKEYRDVRGGRESDGSRGVTRARAGSLHSPSPPPPNPGQEGTLASVVEGWQLLEGFNLRRNDQIYALTFYYFFSPKFCHFASSGNQSREEVLRRHEGRGKSPAPFSPIFAGGLRFTKRFAHVTSSYLQAAWGNQWRSRSAP